MKKNKTIKKNPTALLSVYHKEGIVEFAKQLKKLNWDIIASGGTAKTLKDAGIEVKDVADFVGKAILGHRVVTLSREVHAGLMARPDMPEDVVELENLGIPFIDLVCVDLYPLYEEISNPKATFQSIIEKTDVGGPTMLHSAAKGERIVVCKPEDRQSVIDWLKQGKPDEKIFMQKLASKADALVADYCLASARYHGQGLIEGIVGTRVLECKYGENPQQAPAALYSTENSDPLALPNFKLIAGSPLSYNNCTDLDRLMQTLTHIAAAYDKNRHKVPNIAVAGKHGNSCGASVGDDPITVLQNTVTGDTRAIFGGIVMTNFPIGESEADVLLTYGMPKGRRLLDGIIAPSFTPEAIEALRRKGDKCRFLANLALEHLSEATLDTSSRFRYVRGGFLIQPNYTHIIDLSSPNLEKIGKSSSTQEDDILLAWAIGTTSNSNTITLVRKGQLIGNGVGQQDRVGACQLAVKRAKDAEHSTQCAVAYSDSFFPYEDAVGVLAEAGVKLIYSSSGSVRDADVKSFCFAHGVVLYLFPDTMGRGFYAH